MDVNSLKNLLKKYNLKPNFTYGQNFLLDESVLNDILDAADLSSRDAVLEIGPGIGNLTRRLCERAGFVLSIEKDSKFLPVLRAIKKEYRKKFRYEIADVLEYNFQEFLGQGTGDREGGSGISCSPLQPQPYKVVANIPYYITGKILEMLLWAKHKPSSVTILTQKEVAERVCAEPGNLSVLAIATQIFGEPKIIRIVPASSFYPKPRVSSAILHIAIRRQPKSDIADEKKFFRIIKACFAGKRKQIHNTLVNNLRLEKHRALEILSSLMIDPKTRPQELTIEQWAELAEKIFNFLI